MTAPFRHVTTFAEYGRALGLADDAIVDALCEALTAAGPAAGGRFVGLHHAVEDDPTSCVAVEALLARRTRRPSGFPFTKH